MKHIVIELKPEKNKRYNFLVLNPKTLEYKKVKFGAKDGSTFIDHKDPVKKKNYIARHSKLNEDWNDPFTAGFWSRWYLWSKPTIKEVEEFMNRRFGIEFI